MFVDVTLLERLRGLYIHWLSVKRAKSMAKLGEAKRVKAFRHAGYTTLFLSQHSWYSFSSFDEGKFVKDHLQASSAFWFVRVSAVVYSLKNLWRIFIFITFPNSIQYHHFQSLLLLPEYHSIAFLNNHLINVLFFCNIDKFSVLNDRMV